MLPYTKKRIVSVIHYKDGGNNNIRHFYVWKIAGGKKKGLSCKNPIHFSCVLLSSWSVQFAPYLTGSTSEIPTGNVARVGYTYHPCMPTILECLLALWCWAWCFYGCPAGDPGKRGVKLGVKRVGERVHGGRQIWVHCDSGRVAKGRAGIEEGRQGKKRKFTGSVRVVWLLMGIKIMERQKEREKQMWPMQTKREKRWWAGNIGDQRGHGKRESRWGDVKA